jgi:hypothetical protein
MDEDRVTLSFSGGFDGKVKLHRCDEVVVEGG